MMQHWQCLSRHLKLLPQAIMKRPMLAADGRSYEHTAIEGWLEAGTLLSPVTGEQLPHRDLLPNHALRNMISALLSR